MYMIRHIFGILYASRYKGFYRSFILSSKLPEVHIWGVTLGLRLTHTNGPLFFSMQRCFNL